MSAACVDTSASIAVASALYVAREPEEMWFVTLDKRQRSVAEAVGFKV